MSVGIVLTSRRGVGDVNEHLFGESGCPATVVRPGACVTALVAAIAVSGCSASPSQDQLNPTTAISTSRVGTAAGYFLVQGAILAKYDQCGGPAGWLGQPTSDEKIGPNGGRLSEFQSGSIYWTPRTGAHPVSGQILWAWNAGGGPDGPLGYPIGDQHTIPDGTEASFEHGTISYVGGQAQIRAAPR